MIKKNSNIQALHLFPKPLFLLNYWFRVVPLMPAMTISPAPAPLSIGDLAQRIHLIRGQRVVQGTDLAAFYREATKRFNEQVKRNAARFPADFMFQLTTDESDSLRSQIPALRLHGTRSHHGSNGAQQSVSSGGVGVRGTVLCIAHHKE